VAADENQIKIKGIRELLRTSWGRDGVQVEVANKPSSERGMWRDQGTILETARCDIRRSAIAADYRGEERSPVVILTNALQLENSKILSMATHKLSQRELSSGSRALVKLE
jgi:hypothetical protein